MNIVVTEIDEGIGWKQDSADVCKVIVVEKYKWRAIIENSKGHRRHISKKIVVKLKHIYIRAIA